MEWVLLVHLGLPLLFGLSFTLFRTASSQHVPNWDIALDTALDLAVLGIGATGAIFENPAVASAFGEHLAATELGVVGASFFFSALIVTIKRYVFEPSSHKFVLSMVAIVFGSLALFITSAVLGYAFHPDEFGARRLLSIAILALGGAALAGLTISVVVKLIISSVPYADRLAADPRTIKQVSRGIGDLESGDALTVEDLDVIVQRRSGGKSK